MSWFESLLLGLLQGQTEFLPVSSSGHLVLLQHILGVKSESVYFEVAVHFGTLLTVFFLYRKVIVQLLSGLFRFVKERRYSDEIHLIAAVVVGSVPTAVMGLSFRETFTHLFSSLGAIAGFFAITGALLFVTPSGDGQKGPGPIAFDLSGVRQIKLWKAFIIGLVQGFAIAPGISRSGSTIVAGIGLKVERNTAAMFSFLLSVPAILGATLLQILEIDSMNHQQAMVTGVGVVSAFLSGLLGLKVVLHFVKQGQLRYFSYYLWALSLGLVVYLFLLR